MVSVIADVLDRLGRVPEVPIKQLTTTVLPQLLMALAREKWAGSVTQAGRPAATIRRLRAGTRQPARRATSAGHRTSR